MTRERSDEEITLGRLAALFGVIAEMESERAEEWKTHNHDSEELQPKGDCRRCDWLRERGAQ